MVKEKIIFLLGNGFSQGFGFPSMEQLWDESLKPVNSVYKQSLIEAQQKFPLSYFSEKNLKDIELLLTIWKTYAEANNDFGANKYESGLGYYENYIKNFCAILHKFFVDNRLSISSLHTFLKELLQKYQVVIITTNYDLLVEESLKICNFNYHFFEETINSIPIRKLHGSIAWFPLNNISFKKQIDGPSLIFTNKTDYYVYDLSNFLLRSNNDQFVSIYTQFSKDISNSDFAALIPPAIGKKYNILFQAIQHYTIQDVKDFSKLIIIGYSFPESDPIIKNLILNSCGNSKQNDQEIICIDKNLDVCNKIKNLFMNRNFKCFTEKWSVSRLKQILLSNHGPDPDNLL